MGEARSYQARPFGESRSIHDRPSLCLWSVRDLMITQSSILASRVGKNLSYSSMSCLGKLLSLPKWKQERCPGSLGAIVRAKHPLGRRRAS